MKIYKIYKIVHRQSGKTYVGATCRPLGQRISGHIYRAKRTSNSAIVGYALMTEGLDAFEISIIGNAPTQKEAHQMEKAFVLQFDCVFPKGFNQKLDKLNGVSIIKMPEEVVEVVRVAQKKSFLGRKHSEETKAKMRAAALGKKKSEAMKEKLRKLKTGMKWSEESKAKASKTHTGMKWSDRQREGAMKVFATEEYRKNLSEGVKNAKRAKVENSVSL